jgi:hypothetical protein
LGDLNDWARDVPPATSLNNWCKQADERGDDLQEGQYCVANCAGINNNKSGWFPGEKIKKIDSILKWEKGPNHWINFDNISKQGYCEYVV